MKKKLRRMVRRLRHLTILVGLVHIEHQTSPQLYVERWGADPME